MAIVPCPACGMRVVPKGGACPSCGHPFSEADMGAAIPVSMPGREERPEYRAGTPRGGAPRPAPSGAPGWHVPPAMPAVVKWFGVYALVMALLYFALIAVGVVVMLGSGGAVAGGVLVAMGLLLFAPFLVVLLMEDTSARWTVALVLICLGLTGGCTLPFCILMLIHWIKPETRDYFLQDANP